MLESKAEVASSSNKILGFLKIALAIATLCFWPPDIWLPFTPTPRLNPYVLSADSIKDKAFALVAATLISSIVASALLYLIFSA